MWHDFIFYFKAPQIINITPLLPPQSNFTAVLGDRAVLPCPIEPGALLQQYSVRWMKGNTPIAEYNPQDVMTADDSRYKIDRANYSLIINSVTINDTCVDYKCELSVLNPLTKSKVTLQPSYPVTLSLEIIGK